MTTANPSPSGVGGPEWTARQREVLDLFVRGDTNPQIAEHLGISLDGAKWHVSEIITRLNVDTREEAADYWRQRTGLRPRLLAFARGLLPGSLALRWAAGAAAAAAVATGTVLAVLALSEDEPPADETTNAVATPVTQPSATAAPRTPSPDASAAAPGAEPPEVINGA